MSSVLSLSPAASTSCVAIRACEPSAEEPTNWASKAPLPPLEPVEARVVEPALRM